MKRLLLSLTALLLTSIAFSQVPANDLIENAILIDPSNYSEENIRLDLATTTGVEPGGCGTGTFTKVYYKFTATSDARVNATLTDMIGTAITQSFVVFYTAADLNQTDESLLNLVSDCALASSSTATVTAGQSYYLQVHRSDANAFSRIEIALGPPNDSIENAIEMTSTFYDENIRLDLAAANPGGQVGCDLGGFSNVYYKFTATTDGNVTFFLFPQFGGPVTGNAFVIVYTAANLNATSDSELTINSNCSFDTQPTIGITSGQSYYVLVSRDAPGELSKFSVTIPEDGTPGERQALIDFYNATDGPNWAINTNWDTSAPLSEWAGITVEGGNVVEMGLGNVGVTGTIPISIFNLPFLRSFNFFSNELTGIIPDLTALTNLETFNITGNKFSFADLEPNFSVNSTLTDFRYESQKNINEEIIIDDPIIGQEYTFTTTTTGTNLSYQWYKAGTTFSPDDELIPGATNSDYVIPSLQIDDIFTYTCLVTSPLIPDLTLRRNNIKLRVPVSQSERDALIAIYNSLDGANWDDNENWLSTAHVDDWKGVETFGGQVVVLLLNFQNLNGQLPDEIGDLIYLKEIRMSVNPNLTGSIPTTIGNLTDLKWLRFQQNGMSGEIPASVSNLINLEYVYLQNNQFSGNIPAGFGNAPLMFQMFLNDNQLDGNIPTSIGSLDELVSFDISNNGLSGTLPSELGNLSSILLFGIANNDFSGTLPDWSGISEPENANFDLTNNYFDFSDLEPFINNGVTFENIFYSPQRTLDQEEEIMSPPGADIILDINDANIDRDGQDTASSNQFQWYKDNVAIDGAIANTYTIVNAQISDSGVYFCEITNTSLPDLVIVRANITVIVDDSLNTSDFKNDSFGIYPNPATNWISIKTKLGSDTVAKVFDLNGKLLYEKQLTSEITAIAIDQLSAGMYLISVSSDAVLTTKRFIKQ